MNGLNFERCLVEVTQEVAEQKGIKQKPLAVLAWPNCKDAGTKWRKIRNGSEPRGLRVCDAYALAEAMGISFVELCGLAQARLRDQYAQRKIHVEPLPPQQEEDYSVA